MGKAKSVCDVFISHNSQEKVFTSEIAGVLRSYGLQVFVDSEIPADSKLDVAVWDAMAESQALVAIISDTELSTWLAIEMGAAKAWHKPIYGIVSNPSRVRGPAAFHDMQLYPRSRIDEVAKEIKRSSESMSKEEIDILIDLYRATSVPVDQLSMQPHRLLELTNGSSPAQDVRWELNSC